MAWKPVGKTTVQRQRDRWVVRSDGIDTESDKRRPRPAAAIVPSAA